MLRNCFNLISDILVPFYSPFLYGNQVMWYNSTGIHTKHPFVKYFSASSNNVTVWFGF